MSWILGETHKFFLDEAALSEILNKEGYRDKPICIVSVAGESALAVQCSSVVQCSAVQCSAVGRFLFSWNFDSAFPTCCTIWILDPFVILFTKIFFFLQLLAIFRDVLNHKGPPLGWKIGKKKKSQKAVFDSSKEVSWCTERNAKTPALYKVWLPTKSKKYLQK